MNETAYSVLFATFRSLIPSEKRPMEASDFFVNSSALFKAFFEASASDNTPTGGAEREKKIQFEKIIKMEIEDGK